MKRLVLTAGLTCALALPAIASAQAGRPSNPPSTPSHPTADRPKTSGRGASQKTGAAAGSLAAADKAFVMKAAQGGMAEVELGRLAADKASSPDVKQFGQRMVDDHGKANDELKSLASGKNITLPTELDAKHKATEQRLSKLSGAAFDKAYMADMVADHNTDVAEFAREAKTAHDADLKSWAAKTLPTLQEHQRMAKDVAGKVRGTAAGAKSGTAGRGKSN
jgi:putative membrane protein